MKQTNSTMRHKVFAGLVAALMLACAVPLAAMAGQPDGGEETSVASGAVIEDTSLSNSSQSETSLTEEGQDSSLPSELETSEIEQEEDLPRTQPADGMLRAAPQTAGSWVQFKAALDAIEADDNIGTITLTADFVLEERVTVPAGMNLTIEGGDHALQIETVARRHFLVLGTLTLNGVVLEGNDIGGGVTVLTDARFVMNGGAIQNCRAVRAGGMFSRGTATLTDVLVDKCVMQYGYPADDNEKADDSTGHGTSIYSIGNLTLAGDTVVQNGTSDSTELATVYCTGSNSTMTMMGNATVTNTSFGIYKNMGTLSMQGNSSVTNTTVTAVNVYRGSLVMSGSSFISENTATSSKNSRYVVQLDSSNLTMSGTAQISHNSNTGSGGGVYAAPFSNLMGGTIKMSGYSQISNNTASAAGGGVYALDTSVYLNGHAQISNNTAGGSGGGLLAYERDGENTTSWGMEVWLHDNASMNGNSAQYGGAIYFLGTHAYYYYLGVDRGNMQGVTFANNRASMYGGAIYIAQKQASFNYTSFGPDRVKFSGNWAGKGPMQYTLNAAQRPEHYEVGSGAATISLPTTRTTTMLNNYDVALDGGSPLAGLVDVEFYIDDNTIPAHTKTVLAGSLVDEPTLDNLNLPAGTQLDGWYDDKDGVGIPANKWDFGSHTAAAPGPVKLYAKTLLDPTHEVKVTFYKDSVTAANQLFTDTWDVDEGEATLAALRTRWSLAAADDPLNWKNPDTSLYKTGALVTPATLPPTVDAPLEIVILYAPFAQNDVIFYLNYGPGGDTNEYTRYTNQTEGTTFSAPTDPVREGYFVYKWTTAPAETSTEWLFATDTMPDTQLKLYAQYMKDSFTVTFDYNQVSPGHTVPQTAEFEANLTPVNTSAPGYTFVGWRYEGRYWDFGIDTMPAKNITLIGVWTKDTIPPTSSSSSTTSGGGGNESSAPPPSSSTPRPRASSSSAAPSSSAAAPSSALAVSSAVVSSSSAPPSPSDELNLDFERQMGFLNIPLGDFGEDGGWSLFNLLLALACLASAIVFAVRALRKRDEEDERGGRGGLWQWLAAASGVLPLILWPILENLRGDMLWFSRWTPLALALALAHVALGILAALRARRRT